MYCGLLSEFIRMTEKRWYDPRLRCRTETGLMEETRVDISLIALVLASRDAAHIPGEIQSRVMSGRFVL
ncbi:hypothetical protein ROHU_033300 [Labeo rohita]|uniref:Uncharacterized protein n=1 Tax=Labeo rohita TaxID=84645 RepID=A0A498LIS1_LABRO|nr:hypothetical protein ROHU_033300 [Labeo rohita]